MLVVEKKISVGNADGADCPERGTIFARFLSQSARPGKIGWRRLEWDLRSYDRRAHRASMEKAPGPATARNRKPPAMVKFLPKLITWAGSSNAVWKIRAAVRLETNEAERRQPREQTHHQGEAAEELEGSGGWQQRAGQTEAFHVADGRMVEADHQPAIPDEDACGHHPASQQSRRSDGVHGSHSHIRADTAANRAPSAKLATSQSGAWPVRGRCYGQC